MFRAQSLLVQLALLVAVTAGSPAAAAGAADALRDWLSRIPLAAIPIDSKTTSPFAFADWSQARAVAARDAAPGVDLRRVLRVGVGPAGLRDMAVAGDGGMSAVGFRWDGVGPALLVGQPPSVAVALGGEGPSDHAAIAAALSARGFGQRDIGTIAVWHRLDDFRIDLRLRDPADPFWGPIGGSARIALVDDGILATRAWAPIETILRGDQPTYGEVAPFADLLDAVDAALAPDGRLVQAFSFLPLAFGGPPLEPSPDGPGFVLGKADPGARALPPFVAGLVVDAFAGDRDIALLVLVFVAPEAGDAVAARLAAAISAADELGVAEGAVVASDSYATASGSVAVVSLTSDAGKGQTRVARTPYAGLLRALLRRDVEFLRAAALRQ
jgi:hypothetical protein